MPAAEQQVHRLAIAASGAVTLDGAALSGRALTDRLASLARDPRAELHLSTDGATRYAVFAKTLAQVKHAGITRLGFEGNPSRF